MYWINVIFIAAGAALLSFSIDGSAAMGIGLIALALLWYA
jgi:hypothetical protein